MKTLLIVATLVLFSLSVGRAQSSAPFEFKKTANPSTPSVYRDYIKREVQGYNFRMWLSNQMVLGLRAWDAGNGHQIPIEPHIGAEFPRGSNIEHLFQATPQVGATVDGNIFVSGNLDMNAWDGSGGEILPDAKDSTHNRIWRTSIDNTNEPNKRGFDDDGDGRIDEDDLDGLDNDGDWDPLHDDLGADGLPDERETGCKGEYNASTNPDPAFDNYDPTAFDSCRLASDNYHYARKDDRTRYTQGNGLTEHGEPHVDEDYFAISHNDLYCSATDTFTTPIYSTHKPLGIKIWQRSYAWREKDLEEILPFDYYIINIGKKVLRNVYVGFFVDADVGYADSSDYPSRNYSAYFADRRTAYTHNPVDRGATPLGLMLLGANRSFDSLTTIFRWHGFSEPGTGGDSTLYEWMNCGTGPEIGCIQADQPVNTLFDTRFIYSVGPFPILNPGDTIKIQVAFITGECAEFCPGNLHDVATKALRFYHTGYRTSSPTSVDGNQEIPGSFHLYDAYPNPFNPSTNIAFDLAAPSTVTIRIFDLLGREIAHLGQHVYTSGRQEVKWNAAGQPSGMYILRLDALENTAHRRMYSGMKKIILAK